MKNPPANKILRQYLVDDERDQLFQEILQTDVPDRKIHLFKQYAEKVIALDNQGKLNNFPWDHNDKDGFPHQSAAYMLMGNLVHWVGETDNTRPSDNKYQTIQEIEDLVGYLELPPQYDDEPRNENDPRLPERERDWQRVVELVNSL